MKPWIALYPRHGRVGMHFGHHAIFCMAGYFWEVITSPSKPGQGIRRVVPQDRCDD